MPLTQCPDCGREISTRARHCVHCGRPWPACGNCVWSAVLGLAIAALIVGGAVFMTARCRAKAMKCRAEQSLQAPAPAPAPVGPVPEAPKDH